MAKAQIGKLMRLYDREDGICFYCLEPKSFVEVSRDHFIPRSKGGSDGVANRVLSCVTCDTLKSDFDPRSLGLTAPTDLSEDGQSALDTLRLVIRRRRLEVLSGRLSKVRRKRPAYARQRTILALEQSTAGTPVGPPLKPHRRYARSWRPLKNLKHFFSFLRSDSRKPDAPGPLRS